MGDDQPKGTRVNKYLSEVGYCSRRAADGLLLQGRVTINGVVPELGTKVMPGDVVLVDGKQVTQDDVERVYLALNKPVGIVCTTDTRIEPDNIIDFIGFPQRIFPIGRLDKMSEGLILLTNDGDIVNKVLRARFGHEKEYLVQVDRPVNRAFLDAMAAGVPILDTVTKPCVVTRYDRFSFRIILTQGLNRQIRRMCEHLGFRVRRLRRERVMNIHLYDLPMGCWRHLSQEELDGLHRSFARAEREVGPFPG